MTQGNCHRRIPPDDFALLTHLFSHDVRMPAVKQSAQYASLSSPKVVCLAQCKTCLQSLLQPPPGRQLSARLRGCPRTGQRFPGSVPDARRVLSVAHGRLGLSVPGAKHGGVGSKPSDRPAWLPEGSGLRWPNVQRLQPACAPLGPQGTGHGKREKEFSGLHSASPFRAALSPDAPAHSLQAAWLFRRGASPWPSFRIPQIHYTHSLT